MISVGFCCMLRLCFISMAVVPSIQTEPLAQIDLAGDGIFRELLARALQEDLPFKHDVRPIGRTSCLKGRSSWRARARSSRKIPSPARSIWASGSVWIEGTTAMEMKHSLSMQQKPTLIMTQRLQHALKLLQMPTLELQQALKMELERNPLLEEVDEVEEVQEIEEVKKEQGQDDAEPV